MTKTTVWDTVHVQTQSYDIVFLTTVQFGHWKDPPLLTSTNVLSQTSAESKGGPIQNSTETLAGLVTIRAFPEHDRIMKNTG
ncbi:uncharacterized protein ARMOST_12456 [Armillaria ostoyae]|uniref:Uncharacterized protein n=1 Tax=Armillaria ostoyae TaxID=47428 RepID=A0A284RK02_ARMOS|nr:uncharacterized protein ARMOST_12456 [Armillaria ostoyae]